MLFSPSVVVIYLTVSDFVIDIIVYGVCQQE